MGLARTTKFLHFVVVLVCGKVAEMNDVISSGDREANRQAVRERERTQRTMDLTAFFLERCRHPVDRRTTVLKKRRTTNVTRLLEK